MNQQIPQQLKHSNFADRLKKLMQQRKISQQQIADDIGVTRQLISSYLREKTNPTAEIIVRIADKYKVSSDYLLGLAANPSTVEKIQVSCKTTGLTESAIQYLWKLKNSPQGLFELDILSYLIAHGDMRKILAHFRILMTAIYRQTLTGTEENKLYSEVNEYNFSKVMVLIYRGICGEGLTHFFDQSKTMFNEEAAQNIEKLEILKAQIEKTLQELNNGKEVEVTQQDFNAALVRLRMENEGLL